MIRKLTTFLPLFLVLFFISSQVASAAVNTCSGAFADLCTYDLSTLSDVVSNGINILFVVATVASLFFLIFGGIKWITSGGDKAQLETARNMLLAAAIGLAITFLSYFILNIILELFGLPTANEWNIPILTAEPTATCGPGITDVGACPDGQSCVYRYGGTGDPIGRHCR